MRDRGGREWEREGGERGGGRGGDEGRERGRWERERGGKRENLFLLTT